MRQDKFDKILANIRTLELDGEHSPRKVSELDELLEYGTFNNIVRKLERNEVQFSIPNHKLYEVYNYVVPKNERTINKLFLLVPHFFAFLLTIYGIFNGNYWLIFLFPIVIISTPLSSIFRSSLFYLIALSAIFYLYYSGYQHLSFLLTYSLLTIFSTHYLRIHRRKSLVKIAVQNEEIFSFLFFSKTLSVIDRDRIVYSGMKY